MWGRTVFTKYGGGCLRNLLISREVPKTGDIDQIHVIRGKLYEDTYGDRLDATGTDYERELAIYEERDDGIFTGHIDYFVGGSRVDELKSTQSKSRLRDIKKGEYIEDNLAQAVSYMMAQNVQVGKLVYSYWEPQPDGALDMKLEYEHNISIDKFGRIWLNDVASKWSVHDILAHQHHAFKVLSENIVWDRPHNYSLLWGSPCGYCPFKGACDKYDADGLTTADELIDLAKRGTSPLAISSTSEKEVSE